MGLSQNHLIVMMGISGCGKSTIGRRLADNHDWTFLEGDDFHPDANINKMSSGIPLTDQDRVAWMDNICHAVSTSHHHIIVLACSALTSFVQGRLNALPRQIHYVCLDTQNCDLPKRLRQREHFMPVDLMASQLDALSVPQEALIFDASLAPGQIVQSVSNTLSDRLSMPESAL